MILKPFMAGAALKRYGYDLDAFPFDDAYLDKLLGFLGRDRAGIDLDRFAEDHFNLLYGFIQARKIEAAFPSVEQETKALTKAQDAAWKLVEALEAVRRCGEAGKRLTEDAGALFERQFQKDDVTLADLFAGPDHNPQGPLNALLFDLRVALQRAKIEKPRKPLPIMDGTLLSAKERSNRRVRFAAQDDYPEARYHDRFANHGLAANSALTHFAVQLAEIWPKYSDRTFTEGRYEGAKINYSSRTSDFAETCLKAFGAKYPRNLIAKKLRLVREVSKAQGAQ